MSRSFISPTNVLQPRERAGLLRERIVIQQRQTTTNPRSGEEVITYTTIRTCQAQVTYGSESDEKMIALQETPLTRAFFTIRQTPTALYTTMRVVYDSRNWDVMAVHKIGREFTRLECQANTDANDQ